MGSYIATIGLEIHVQLKTKRKIFSPENFEFGIRVNSATSPVSLALPGSLPTINTEAISLGIKLGLVCDSNICHDISFARKNYFYPDLPKGYQITQDETPICKGGHVKFDTDGKEKTINLTRIHLEEDAGKITRNNGEVIIDFNRAGVSLVEIVTEPEFNSGQEVFDFLHELRRIVRYLGISNGNMEEGSLRCDANISIREEKDTQLGTRVEVKNMNSISNVKKAIESEIKRQERIIKDGGVIRQETRMFDVNREETVFQREKEAYEDYKYFQEPDINPIHIPNEWIESIRKTTPPLPREHKRILIKQKGLSEYQAQVLIENEDLLHLFEEMTDDFNLYTTTANWILGPIKGFINKIKIDARDVAAQKEQIQTLISMVENGEINYSIATQQVLPYLLMHKNETTKDIVLKMNAQKNEDEEEIIAIIDAVLNDYNEKIAEYKKGKKGLLGLFVGEVMKRTKGKGDPKFINEIILEKLK